MNYLKEMEKIRYLLIGDGSSPHVAKWVKELNKYFEVSLIYSRDLHPEIADVLSDEKRFPIDKKIRSEGGNNLLIFEVPRVLSVIRKIRPDFVNAHYITSYGLIAAIVKKLILKRFFLVQSAWGTDILVTPFSGRAHHIASRFSLNTADLVTSDSEYMSDVVRRLTHTPIVTFSFGLDRLPEYHPELKQKGLFLSNRILSDNYNIDEVIRFFSRIADRDKSARLIVTNDGERRPFLEELTRKLCIDDRVQFCGFLSAGEQEEWYKKAEFFISIPTSDSTSVSLLEAMAHGCIPIVSDIPANHEWITDGIGGICYSGDLGFDSIEQFRKTTSDAIQKNRKLVSDKAIFPDSISYYSQYLMKQISDR